MLTPTQIVTQLQETLPLVTDSFHDSLPITGASVASGVVTVTLASGHGLVVGQNIMINSVQIRNEISSVVENADDTVSYFTANDHDLTAYSADGHGNTWPDGLTVEIDNDGTDETITLLTDSSAIPSELEFVGEEGSPIFTPTGSEYLLETRGIGVVGFQELTESNDTTIVFELIGVPDIPDGDLVMSDILTNVRVATVANIERALEIYTKQTTDEAWLFVIMLDRRVSNNRANTDDLVSLPASSEKLINIIQEFSTLVIMPTSGDLGSAEVKSFIYTTLFENLLSSLYGWEAVGYSNDGDSTYNTGYYSHSFEWEARQQINYEDGFQTSETEAFRAINFTQTVFDEGDSIGTIELFE